MDESYVPSNSGKVEYWETRLDYLQRTRKLMWNEDYMHFLVQDVWKINKPITVLDCGCCYRTGAIGVGKVISAIGTIMTIVPKLAGVINAAKGVFAAFNTVCAANTYVLIIAAIVALVAAFIYFWSNCEELHIILYLSCEKIPALDLTKKM